MSFLYFPAKLLIISLLSARLSIINLQTSHLIVGALVTAGVLGAGLHSFYKRDSPRQQYFMRMRVAAQGFTVLGLLGWAIYHKQFDSDDNAAPQKVLTEVYSSDK